MACKAGECANQEKGMPGRENQEKEERTAEVQGPQGGAEGREGQAAGKTEEDKFLARWSNGSVLDLAREVKKVWAQNQLLIGQVQQMKQQLRKKVEEEED